MYLNRLDLYKELEREFDGKLILYVTSDRPNMSAKIASDVIDLFVNHLDEIGNCSRIILYLYTRGGDTSAAWNIVNLIRMFGDELVVIVPHKAHSAGTIISLGANKIVMTKQATLSPIDPSITTPLNPIIPNTNESYPVSVEAVNGYLDYAREELEINDSEVLAKIFMKCKWSEMGVTCHQSCPMPDILLVHHQVYNEIYIL
ncbi:MAG: ATP-dependent Clp protease proteolytic subunit [Methanosphaera sp.]|nr:ATP-dependent Clp protease proteolytic subunit [Methanosphaera sp.]